MTHPIVDQLVFARSEFLRAFDGVTPEEALQRIGPMNSINWIIGHLADQEQRYFLKGWGLPLVVDGLNDKVGSGKPASTPPLDEMWVAWKAVTAATLPVVSAMSSDDLLRLPPGGGPPGESNGTMALRVIGHYWYHIGEGQAIRQMLGHTNLPQFVGNLGQEAPFRLE